MVKCTDTNIHSVNCHDGQKERQTLRIRNVICQVVGKRKCLQKCEVKSYKQALSVQPLLSRSIQSSDDIIDEGTNAL